MSIDSRLERVLADKPAALAHATSATHLLIHCAALLERHLEQALAPSSYNCASIWPSTYWPTTSKNLSPPRS